MVPDDGSTACTTSPIGLMCRPVVAEMNSSKRLYVSVAPTTTASSTTDMIAAGTDLVRR